MSPSQQTDRTASPRKQFRFNQPATATPNEKISKRDKTREISRTALLQAPNFDVALRKLFCQKAIYKRLYRVKSEELAYDYALDTATTENDGNAQTKQYF